MENKYKNFDWNSLGFDFGNWEEELVWSLNLPVQEIEIKLLLWHLDVPYWENDKGQRWTVSPRDVMNKERGTKKEQQRTSNVDLSYPLDLFEHNGKLFVLDGLHRLLKKHMSGSQKIQVRILPKDRFYEVASSHPFELP